MSILAFLDFHSYGNAILRGPGYSTTGIYDNDQAMKIAGNIKIISKHVISCGDLIRIEICDGMS